LTGQTLNAKPMPVPVFFCGPSLLQQDAGTVFRLLLLAPLLEEWIVRAGLQAWLLQRWPAAPALLASAAAFSALHLGAGWQAAGMVFGPGLLMGWTYQRWRDWRLCAVLHGLCNAFALIFCRIHFI
jgi:membrane protease YdiL (CAAX protease family)